MFSSTYYVFCMVHIHSQRTYCALGALGTPGQAFPMLGEVASYTVLQRGELRHRLGKGQIARERWGIGPLRQP